MFIIKQLKDLKQENNKWIIQVEWEGHSGCDTWEPIKNILKDAKPDVIRLLEKYNKEENLPKYLRKMTVVINIKNIKKNRKLLKQLKKKLQKSSNVKIFINKEQLIIQKLSGMQDTDPMKSIIYIIKNVMGVTKSLL